MLVARALAWKHVKSDCTRSLIQASERYFSSAQIGLGRKEEDVARLAPSQTCKNLLAGNWRGQLTFSDPTVSDDPSMPKILSSLAMYASPRGRIPPLILLENGINTREITNLRLDPRASLTIGRTDPVSLMQSVRAAGFNLPCLSLYGHVREISTGEGPLRVQFIASKLAYVLRQNDKIAVQATGFPQKWEQRWNKDSTQAFALDIASVRHYDMRGVETRVQLEDVDGSFLDPLALGQTSLLASVNSSPEMVQNMRLFSAAYINCKVKEVLMTQADRWGFTLLGQPIHAKEGDPWLSHRFDFVEELPDTDAFLHQLARMHQEAEGRLDEQMNKEES